MKVDYFATLVTGSVGFQQCQPPMKVIEFIENCFFDLSLNSYNLYAHFDFFNESDARLCDKTLQE